MCVPHIKLADVTTEHTQWFQSETTNGHSPVCCPMQNSTAKKKAFVILQKCDNKMCKESEAFLEAPIQMINMLSEE